MPNTHRFSIILTVFVAVLSLLIVPVGVSAHCDSYSGPVIPAAKLALEKGDVTPLLKWVTMDDEAVIKEAFRKTLAVRSNGPEAKELADTYFIETFVRLHRTSEGAPYTGLKNEPIEPIVALTDKALETGKADSLLNKVSAHVKAGIKERFVKAADARKKADSSVEAGREYVAAYVELLHYIEGIHIAAMGKGGHGEGPASNVGNCQVDKK